MSKDADSPGPIQSEIKRWGAAVTAAGIQPQ
jgi:hypothetical protein